MPNPLNCPKCSHRFSIKESRKSSSKCPLILECGHSICESCLTSYAKLHKYYKCSVCNIQTMLPEGVDSIKSFNPSIYVLDLLKSRQKTTKDLLTRPEFVKAEVVNQTNESKIPKNCFECGKKAVSHCESCSSVFCTNCWIEIHKSSKYMKNHKEILIEDMECNKNSDSHCNIHDKVFEFYCEDDHELACCFCAVTGSHKGHNVVALSQKQITQTETMKEAINIGLKSWNHLNLLQKELSSLEIDKDQQHKKLRSQLKMEFIRLHGLLERREKELNEELDNYCLMELTDLKQMKICVVDKLKGIHNTIKDAKSFLSGQESLVNTFILEKKLLDSKIDLPFLMLKSSHKESIQLSCDIDNGLIRNFGTIKWNETSHRLAREEELPSDIKTKYTIDYDIKNLSDFDDSVLNISNQDIAENSEISSQSSITDDSSNLSSCSSVKTESIVSRLEFSNSSEITSNEGIHVSHVVNPCNFWVIRTKDIKKLMFISKQLRNYSKRGLKIQTSDAVKNGQLFVTQYSVDQNWYRAQVKKVKSDHGKQKILVSFIDYGNCEEVEIDQLHDIIDAKIVQHPPLAHKCKLYDIKPVESEWSLKSVKIFHNFVAGKNWNIKVIEKAHDSLIIDLLQPSFSEVKGNFQALSVRDSMVFLKIASFVVTPEEAETVNQSVAKLIPETSINGCFVSLCHIENVSSFYVQKQGAKAKKLVEIMKQMQDAYSDSSECMYNLLFPKEGSPCAIKFTEDELWYRAEIISFINNTKVLIKYVDYGNTEEIDIWNVKRLLNQFQDFPTQAVHCALSDVIPTNCNRIWTQEALLFFTEICEDQRLEMVVKGYDGDKSMVVLKIKEHDNEVNVNSLLVEKCYALSTGPNSEISDIKISHQRDDNDLKNNKVDDHEILPLSFVPSKKTEKKKDYIINKKKNLKKLYQIPENNVLEASKLSDTTKTKSDYIPINIIHVESPSSMFFKIKSELNEESDSEFTIMMNSIQNDYHNVVESGNKSWKEEDPCCVKCSKDGIWYRGVVKEIDLDQDLALVYLVDFGQTLNVTMNSLCLLEDKFQVFPAFCVKCHLVGLKAAGDGVSWSQMAKEYLAELVDKYQNDLLMLHLKDQPKVEGSIAIELLYEVIRVGGALEPTNKSFINVAKKLIEDGLALPDRNYHKFNSNQTAEKNNKWKENIEKSKLHDDLDSDLENLDIGSNQYMKTWKPPMYPILKTFKCKPTYVDDNANIYLHDIEKGERNLKVLENVIQIKFKDSQAKASDLYWYPGQICIVQFHVDEKWYRGQVLAIKEDGIEVKFTDYGNTEIVKPDKIRKDIVMSEMPSQCVFCELCGLKPISKDGKWSIDILDFIHKNIVDKICTVSIKNFGDQSSPPKISLYIDDLKMDLKDLLLDGDLASENPEDLTTSKDLNEINVIDDCSVFEPFYIPESNEPFRVVVTVMSTPLKISIQKIQQNDSFPKDEAIKINSEYEKFLKMSEYLEKNGFNFDVLVDASEGSVGCAFSENQKWYRAEILKVINKMEYLVSFIDFGNCETVSANRMRILPSNLLKIPTQAATFTLHQVMLSNNDRSAEIAAKMMHIFFNSGCLFYAKIKTLEPDCKIDLFIKDDAGNFRLAYQSLIDEKDIALVREVTEMEFM